MAENLNYRSDCEPPLSVAELNINNVRARLYSGRAKWYRFRANKRGYQVPNLPGQSQSYSIFSGATLKIGAFDEEDNLKMAFTGYESGSSVNFRPGPLSQNDGTTSADICRDWDRFFEVRNEDIEIHRQNIEIYVQNGQIIPHDLIPDRIKYWPGMGNPFFNEKFDFTLPAYSQGVAPFFDFQGNGLYHPEQGDFPVIGNANCTGEYHSRVPDQMFWWVTNDAGYVSQHSWQQPMRIELHNQAFAFKSDVELNDMTFYRYRMINRGPLDLDSLYFGVLTHPNLSCPLFSDYFGSYPELDMMFVYQNFNVQDPCSCLTATGPIPTYCDHFPAAGISFLDGLENQTGDRLGMSVFMYYHNHGGSLVDPGMYPPATMFENYRYLSGSWRDGRPLTFGGNGFDEPGGERVLHAFPGNPRFDIWTYCTTNLPIGDKRVVMSSGPVRLSSGGVNDLTIVMTN